MTPGVVSVEQVARVLHAPLPVIYGLQEHNMLPAGSVMQVALLRQYVLRLPWLKMLDMPMAESEVASKVSHQLSFPEYGPAACAMSGRRYVKLYRVLAYHWGLQVD